MAELFKVNAPVRKPLFEGVQGENEARSIQFDITPWVEELGDGAFTATAKRSQDSQPYPVTVTKDGNTVTWKPTSTDTAFAGVGSFQLEYTVDSVLAKTCIWSTMVAPSLDPAGDPPDPYDNWLAEMRQIAADALQSAQDAEQSAQDAAGEVTNAQAEVQNAEAWAKGTKGGVDVPSTDPTYENNSKYWAEQSLANQYGAFIVKSASGQIASFNDGADDVPMKSVKVAIVPKQSGSGDPSPTNVRPITGWTDINVIVSPTTTASDGTTTPVPLGQTVYGGTVDVVSGEWEKTKVGIDMGSLDWRKSGPYSGFYATLAGIKRPSWGSVISAISSMYRATSFNEFDDLADDYIFAGEPTSDTLYVRNPDYTDASAFKTAMAGQMIVYDLATPTTVQLTPAQVATLLGTNNVWSDAGSVAVEYRADPTLAYNELANVIVSLGGNI